MRISLIFIVLTTTFQAILGFLYGYLVYLQPKGYRIYKILLFVPNVLPSVATGFIWSYIYSPSMGILKPLMEAIGLGQYYISPIADPKLALVAVVFAQIWSGLGVQVILFNSGFMNIPSEVIESAKLDGATGWKMIKTMVIPMSWDITKMVIILQTIGALRSFDSIYVMTAAWTESFHRGSSNASVCKCIPELQSWIRQCNSSHIVCASYDNHSFYEKSNGTG